MGSLFVARLYVERERPIINVTHPEFVRHDGQGHSVDDTILIELMPGRQIRITAVDGASGEPIRQRLFALIPGGELSGKSFRLQGDGALVSKAADPATETLLVVALPESGPPLFSDLIDLRKSPRIRRPAWLLWLASRTRGRQSQGRVIFVVSVPESMDDRGLWRLD